MRAPLILLPAVVALFGAGACVLGSEQAPGCRTDHPDDCQTGWSCRAGVCFHPTTPQSPPVDPDAASEGGADAAGTED